MIHSHALGKTVRLENMGETIKLKTLREKFEEEYAAVIDPADNKQGFKIKYVYYGLWYLWNLPEEELKKQKKQILAVAAVNVLVFILAAAIPVDLNRYALVAFPGILAILAIILKMVGVSQFVFAKYRTARSTFEDADRRIRIWSVVHTVCSGAAALGCVYYVIGFGVSLIRLASIVLYSADAVLALVIFRKYVRIPMTTEKNDILKYVERAAYDA